MMLPCGYALSLVRNVPKQGEKDAKSSIRMIVLGGVLEEANAYLKHACLSDLCLRKLRVFLLHSAVTLSR